MELGAKKQPKSPGPFPPLLQNPLCSHRECPEAAGVFYWLYMGEGDEQREGGRDRRNNRGRDEGRDEGLER